MSRSAEQILSSRLNAHCPDGFAWPKDESSNVAGYLYPGAGLIADAEALLDALKLEINPGTATLLLSDYEQALGPDPCGRDSLALTTALRQSLAHQRWVSVGDNTIPFFVQMAASLGVSIEIEEPNPPVCGTAIAGVDVCGNEDLLLDWIVHIKSGSASLEADAAISGVAASGVSICGSVIVPVISDVLQQLYCPMQREAPADTHLYIKDQELS
nr:putative phage tail protein [uncultured Acetobacter sp.]